MRGAGAWRLWRGRGEPLSCKERVLRRGSPRFFAEGRRKTNPRPANHPHNRPTSSPRGSHPEGKPLVGMGAAPAASLASWTREASGHRPGDTRIPVRGARWNGRWHHAFVPCRTARQPDEGNWRLGLAAEAGLRPDKRGPEYKIADKRSATGRAGSGSICPRRILAQWMRISTQRASRRSAAPRDQPTPEGGRGFRLCGFAGRREPLPLVGRGRGGGRKAARALDRLGAPSMPFRQTPTRRHHPHPFPSPQGGGVCGPVLALPGPEVLGTSPSRTPWWVRRNR